MMTWDKEKTVVYVRAIANPPFGNGQCAAHVVKAIEIGGLTVHHTRSAKDYGSKLTAAGFVAQLGVPIPYQIGDVAVIDGFTKSSVEGIRKDHLDGHVAIYDGMNWISDYVQTGVTPYPGSQYEKAKPSFVIYRVPN